ncbi:MAG TPA: thioesterase family protein [Polyangia bacterium]|jgi:acyl-CoA thioester hydrolase|nr:thioesterase family protein [Polyangia bacterium]
MSPKPAAPVERRADYPHFLELQTRWIDNDVYGHVNNVVYYAYFDTVINRYLIDEGGLDITGGETLGVCVESQCRYLRSIAFPDRIEAGLRVGTLGRSSVRYEIGIFRHGVEEPCATGYFVHVFVDRGSREPVSIPDRIRAALTRLVRP